MKRDPKYTELTPVETVDQPRIHGEKFSGYVGENNWKKHKPITESIAWTWRTHRFGAPRRPIDEPTRLRRANLCDAFYREARAICRDLERVEFTYPLEDARLEDR